MSRRCIRWCVWRHREGERPVSLAELVASDEPVRVSEALTITPSAPSDAVSGKPVTVPGQFSGGGALSAVVVPMNFREADERICKSIGVDRDRGAAVMAKLWGRTFSTSATTGQSQARTLKAKARFHGSSRLNY